MVIISWALEQELGCAKDEELVATANTATRLLQRLIDVAGAIIRGDAPNLDQREIDDSLNNRPAKVSFWVRRISRPAE